MCDGADAFIAIFGYMLFDNIVASNIAIDVILSYIDHDQKKIMINIW